VHARTVDEAAAQLRALRAEERGDLGLAALALVLAVAAAEVWPALALPLLVGGLVLGVLGIRALWRRWDMVDRLSGQRDAYAIPEVLAYAMREADMESRQSYAALIRGRLVAYGRTGDVRILAVVEELEALASELDDRSLALDPVAAVECRDLLSELSDSPLLDVARSPDELRWRIRQIRSGLGAKQRAA
jgi:hypothetical protein